MSAGEWEGIRVCWWRRCANDSPLIQTANMTDDDVQQRGHWAEDTKAKKEDETQWVQRLKPLTIIKSLLGAADQK